MTDIFKTDVTHQWGDGMELFTMSKKSEQTAKENNLAYKKSPEYKRSAEKAQRDFDAELINFSRKLSLKWYALNRATKSIFNDTEFFKTKK
jgi:hypothetical protein